MAVAGYLPRSEGELARSLPGSNRLGIFPRSALLGEEKVVYETRPTFFGLRLLSFWIPLPVVALLILVVIDAAFLPDPAFGVAATGIFTFLFAIPMLYAVNYWRTTAYALTDQRVIVSEGNSFQSATYDRVTDVTMGKGSSRLVFSLVPDTPPGTPPGRAGRKVPTLLWKGVPGAPAVASFAKSALQFYRLRQQQRLLRQNLVVSSLEDRVVCEYCAALISVSTLQPENPRCPRCAAPITVAPLGM
ncbi:MAG: hypothetical protein ABSB90_09825 [Thermoplasmata archaeon]